MNSIPSSPAARSTTTSRRTVVAGAAWAVPAIALGTMAPAYANSGPCLDIPNIGSWTRTDQDVNEKPFRLINGNKTLEAIIDWAWWSGKARPAYGYGWARTQLRVQPGHRYVINLGLETCKGYNYPGNGSPGTCQTNPTTLDVIWTPTGGASSTIFRGTTQSIAGYTLFEPIANCNGPVPNRTPRWRAFPDQTVTFEVPCGSARTGVLELKFTAYPHARVTSAGGPSNATATRFSNQNNDDWRVTPQIVSCERFAHCSN